MPPWLPKHFMFMQTECWGKITVSNHQVLSQEPAWFLKWKKMHEEFLVYLKHGEVDTKIERTEMLKGRKHIGGDFWSDLFYRSSLTFYCMPSWLFGLVQNCTAVPWRFPGEWVLSSCVTFVLPFHSWFWRSEHVIMIWETHVVCQITHPLLQDQLCERRSITEIDRGLGPCVADRAWWGPSIARSQCCA